MRIVVAIVTLGRPDTVGAAVLDLARQTRQPDRVVVSATGSDDYELATFELSAIAVEVLTGPKGVCRQRNAILAVLKTEDVVLFLDDDFVMASDFLACLERVFQDNPDVVAVTGNVLADGIGNAGLNMKSAKAILKTAGAEHSDRLVTVNNGYGCNMAFCCEPIREHGLRFDEVLPLYGWLEDVDFSQRIATYGRCVRAQALRGVHLGIKAGRTSGVRLGYSQIANPVYLTRRTTMRRGHAAQLIGCNLAANIVKSLWSEPWVDRRGRLKGNLVAIGDLLWGRIDPLRVLRLGRSDDRP